MASSGNRWAISTARWLQPEKKTKPRQHDGQRRERDDRRAACQANGESPAQVPLKRDGIIDVRERLTRWGRDAKEVAERGPPFADIEVEESLGRDSGLYSSDVGIIDVDGKVPVVKATVKRVFPNRIVNHTETMTHWRDNRGQEIEKATKHGVAHQKFM